MLAVRSWVGAERRPARSEGNHLGGDFIFTQDFSCKRCLSGGRPQRTALAGSTSCSRFILWPSPHTLGLWAPGGTYPPPPTPHTRAPQPDAGLLAALCALWLYPPARPLGTTRPAHPPPWGPVLSILRCPRSPLCGHRAGRRPARRRQGLCPPGVPAWWTEGPQDFAGRSPSPGRLAAMLGLWVTPKPEGRRVERLLHRSRKPRQRWVGTSTGFVVRRSGFESGSHHNDCVNLGTRRDCSDPRSLSCGRGMPPRRSLDQRRKGY